MNKSWNLIDKILSGEKTIESRWYKTKRAPWGRVKAGDTVYFKDAGEPVTAKANVKRVLQFENADASKIIREYGERICLRNKKWVENKPYCILVFLKEPKRIKPFGIDKSGFGNACAWMTMEKISRS